jgi:hypothetical protein
VIHERISYFVPNGVEDYLVVFYLPDLLADSLKKHGFLDVSFVKAWGVRNQVESDGRSGGLQHLHGKTHIYYFACAL